MGTGEKGLVVHEEGVYTKTMAYWVLDKVEQLGTSPLILYNSFR
jgi:hypothetical protein